MQISIKPLTPGLKDDYLYFFDNLRFEENPDWSACYCFSFHFTGTKDQWTKENNRKAVIKYINEKKLTGYLAYANDVPIGWCNVNVRSNYQSLQKYYDLQDIKSGKICSIVCFTISSEYRRKGIASRILEQICNDYSEEDCDCLEAYPGIGELSSEQHYKGPLDIYLKFGFNVVKEYDNYAIVRKYLK
jgi:ribosomal protein S18 acetylase RimI-like enzyme